MGWGWGWEEKEEKEKEEEVREHYKHILIVKAFGTARPCSGLDWWAWLFHPSWLLYSAFESFQCLSRVLKLLFSEQCPFQSFRFPY